MSLRRLAQANAATTTNSPREYDTAASPRTPIKGLPGPSTPRATRKLIYPPSPMTSPSLSASLPFDWDAARGRRSPPYPTPKRPQTTTPDTMGTKDKKKNVRKRTMAEKIMSIPSGIAFQIELFPNNVPLPPPKTSAYIMGGTMHLLHFIIRVSQIRSIPDSELGWEDLFREDEGTSWFDWTTPVSILLILGSIYNTFRLFTHTRLYQLNMAVDPVASPHAKFVRRESKQTQSTQAASASRRGWFVFYILHNIWRGFAVSVRFLLNMSPPKDRQMASTRYEKVQQLEVWTPEELPAMLFAIYSPVHALLWMAFSSANWYAMFAVMFLVGVQTRALTRSFEALLKDRAIISAEVLHEYDEKFVYPRVNPIRKDAATMTHQAEMVHTWEQHPPSY